MSIRLVPQEQPAGEAATSRLETVPSLLFANLKSLYSGRAERLRQLADNHPLGDYLTFAAQVVEAQQHVQHDHPRLLDVTRIRQDAGGRPPLDAAHFQRDAHWLTLLQALIEELKPQMSGQILSALENLEKMSVPEKEALADKLFSQSFCPESNDKAPFVWAALSIYWAQMASQLPAEVLPSLGEHRQFCPVCGSIPVSAVVHMDDENGLRYLHCNLCETEWHMARVICSNCEQSDHLSYWSLDDELASNQTESCGDCGTYIKLLYQERDCRVEAVADDLASLILDIRMEDEGFFRSSINPFLFPESAV
ncbi:MULTISPECIES: formate dehydrogenase accessory protein FdhE [Lonsdalea]|uniref:Formate dehydrogenase accessory protein FdhE n=2 Tax=Lonsdalea TaxID=1082702 RepID=A0ACD1JCQ5_9GAMM|nr:MULTISPECIES: formate dehydrogenase accessory protein FdhE [Lonsdalea]OSM99105.1 formate dehydrogenase accessory protein FdhE [Lonsdalea populi]OSN02103.1 formate dehydrogenase accessory protein FdhE [Lonsdalea populi]QPQ23173.1 formate dehydrogenase accessory protein FdhE [Lonsdalea populi]RAT13341.1 formate dehydrogenase accessory protein FdhE [Lonsdalea quercina]RAT15000.1 formate dehydrogenase accessory protein FdhE [Lonsdalea quercina]